MYVAAVNADEQTDGMTPVSLFRLSAVFYLRGNKVELRYTLKKYELGAGDPEVLGKALTLNECKEIIKRIGFGVSDWYKIQHRDPANTIDIWSLKQLPK